jgi:hydrogenase nickel incorporation protein HypA/HybF
MRQRIMLRTGFGRSTVMHERSLVKVLIDQVIEEARTRNIDSIREIHVEIGEFAGVEPSLVELAFAEIAVDHWNHPVLLVIRVVPLTAKCLACGNTFRIERFVFHCSQCDSGDVQVTSGEEIRLVSFRAERPAHADPDLNDEHAFPNVKNHVEASVASAQG